MQYAMQYYLFAQKHLTNKVLTLNNYLQTQNSELEKLKKVNNVQRHKTPTTVFCVVYKESSLGR